MNKKQLENFWEQTVALNNSVGLNASTMDDIYDKVMMDARENGIEVEELEIDY